MATVYRQQFKDIHDVLWTVLIGDTSGTPTYVDFTNTGEPLTIDFLSNSSELFDNPVKGSIANISVYADEHFQWTHISSSGELNIPVLITYGETNTVYWRGLISPNTYQEAYDGVSYPVTLVANDGLGLLKEFIINDEEGDSDIDWSGRDTEAKAILDILALIGVTEFTEYVNIYEDRMDDAATDSPFTQAYIDLKVFDNMTCYDALNEILKKYNAYMRQYKGKITIYRPADLYQDSIYGRVISTGSVTAAANLVPEQLISRSGALTNLRDTEGGMMLLKPPHKKITLTQDYGYRDSLLNSYQFLLEEFEDNAFNHWTNNNGNYIRPLSEYVPEENSGMIMTGNPFPVQAFISQTVYGLIESDKDFIEIEFDYGFNNIRTDGLTSSVNTFMYIKLNDFYLGQVYSTGDFGWFENLSTDIRISENNIPVGWTGWRKYKATVDNIPDSGNIEWRIYAAQFNTCLLAIRNLKFRITSSKLQKKRKKRKFFQRLRSSSSGGGMNFDIRPKYYTVTYKESVEPATENILIKTNELAGMRSEFDYILGDVINLSIPENDRDVDIDNILPTFMGSIAVMDGDLVPSHTWNKRGIVNDLPIIELIANEIKEQHSRVRQSISLPISENYHFYKAEFTVDDGEEPLPGAKIELDINEHDLLTPDINILGNFQDSLNQYEDENRIFVFLGGEFNIRDRQWMLDLEEIIKFYPPAAPSSLTLTARESTIVSSIRVNWTDNSNDETGFLVEFKKVADSTWNHHNTNPNVVQYDITFLTVNTQYDVRVRSFNTTGNSDWITGQIYTLLPTPVATAATDIAATSFTANWESVSGATSYRLDVSTVSNFASFVSGYENKTVAGTSDSVTGLTDTVAYYYRVRAVNANSTSFNSNTITQRVGIIEPPTGLIVYAYDVEGRIRAEWNGVTDATKYEVRVNSGGGYGAEIDRGTDLFYTSGRLADETLVCIQVRVTVGGATSEWSTQDCEYAYNDGRA